MAFSTEGQIMSITSEVEIPTALFLKARQVRGTLRRRFAHVACAAPKGCRIPVTDLFLRHPVLEAQRPRALGSGSATHTERSRRSQHESCEGRTMKEVQTKEEIEALRKAYLQRA